MTVPVPDRLSFAASRSTDVLVIGAGPAGLSAAAELATRGLGVVVLDRDTVAGGMPRWCAHSPFGMREFRRILSGASYGDRLAEQAIKAGASIELGHSVVSIETGAVVVASPEGPKRYLARRMLLATGARETSRAGRLLPGERPAGIMNTGALQYFVHRDRQSLPFRRPVVIGSELVALSAMLTLRSGGARPAAIIETEPRLLVRRPFSLFPALNLVPVRTGCEIVAIHGRSRVEAMEIRQGGLSEMIECDGVVVSGRFVPEASLAQMSGIRIDPLTKGPEVDQFGRSSMPHVFAAGNLLRGVETAGWCWQEGRLVGRAVADDLAGKLPLHAALAIRAGEGIARVMPQRLVRKPGGFEDIQLRLARFGRGEIVVRRAGRTIFRRKIDSGPERRVLVPVGSWVESEGEGDIEIAFREAR